GQKSTNEGTAVVQSTSFIFKIFIVPGNTLFRCTLVIMRDLNRRATGLAVATVYTLESLPCLEHQTCAEAGVS
ncbi:hypothetical protein PISMIDRAFT_683831, partial [Pisolithus microcarpus 441]